MVDYRVFSLNLVTKVQYIIDITNRIMQRGGEHSQRVNIKGRDIFCLKTF